MSVDVVDIEGAMRTYLTSYPGLCGAGNPVLNGVHMGQVRSPSRGAVAQQTLIAPRTTDDTTDDARFTYSVRAVGSEQGAREVAEHAARALARALHALDGNNVTVTTRRGEQIKLLVAGSVAGPTSAGDLGGECAYRVDVTVRAQPG
jgi:hypothetical protein